MDFILGKARGIADGLVISIFNMKSVDVPVVLKLITDHRKYLRHGVVDTFDATVSARVVDAGCEFVYAE